MKSHLSYRLDSKWSRVTETLVASALSLSYLNLSTVLCVGACKHAGKIESKIEQVRPTKDGLGF